MTTLTADDYVNRVRAIVATFSGVGTDVTNGGDMTATPGYEAFIKTGVHHRTAGNRRRTVTRVLSLRVYYVYLDNFDFSKEPPLSNARGTVQAIVDSFVDQLYQHVNLSLGDSGIAQMEDVTDSFGIMAYNNRTYFGFDLDFPISYQRN